MSFPGAPVLLNWAAVSLGEFVKCTSAAVNGKVTGRIQNIQQACPSLSFESCGMVDGCSWDGPGPITPAPTSIPLTQTPTSPDDSSELVDSSASSFRGITCGPVKQTMENFLKFGYAEEFARYQKAAGVYKPEGSDNV